MDENKIKKTKGRQRIEIKKIEKKTRLQVAFTKRRNGLFKKARELNILCGAQVAIIALSPANKVFAFESSSVLDHFKIAECEVANFYSDTAIDDMALDELEECSKSLHELKNSVQSRMNKFGSVSSSSNLLTVSNQDSKYKFDDSLANSQIVDVDGFNEDHSLVLEEIRATLMDEEYTQEFPALMIEEYTQELEAALMDEEYKPTGKDFDEETILNMLFLCGIFCF